MKDQSAPHPLLGTDASAEIAALADGASCAAGADCSAAEVEDAMNTNVGEKKTKRGNKNRYNEKQVDANDKFIENTGIQSQ